MRILDADDHAREREAVEAILRVEGDIEIVGEAEDGANVLQLDVARRISPELPNTDIVYLPLDPKVREVARAAGRDAVVFKNATSAELRTVRGFRAMARRRPVGRRRVDRLYVDSVFMIASALEAKEAGWPAHIGNLAEAARRLALRLGLTDAEAERIELALLLRDIGKVAIPEVLLNKREALKPEEIEHVHAHVDAGARILSASPRLRHLVPIVHQHHERYDGSGYPDGLRGGEISLGAQIVGLLDAFNAMVSSRSYKIAFPAEFAFEQLELGAGREFSVELVATFFELYLRDPASLVRRDKHADARDHANLEQLMADVAHQVQQPVDAFEIAAQLESRGVNDEVARGRYVAADVFALAETVLTRLRRDGLSAVVRAAAPAKGSAVRELVEDYLRGPLALIPIVVILLMIAAFRELGRWEDSQVVSLSLGVSASVLLTNGLVQAMSRRGHIYLSRGDRRAAGAFIAGALKAAAASLALVALACATIAAVLGVLAGEVITFLVAFGALSGVWLVAGVLAMVGRSVWLGVGLAAGLAAGALVDRLTAESELHLALGAAVGFVLASAIMIRAARAGLRPGAVGQSPHATLPSRGYLLHEALPYFAYGSLYIVLVFTPHAVGWAAAWGSGSGLLSAGTALEVGLGLALAPIILAGGVAEHAARRFWARARVDQSRTPADRLSEFTRGLNRFYRGQLVRYLAVLGVMSALAYVAFTSAVAENPGGVLETTRMDLVAIAFVAGLIGYWLLGWGLFNCLFIVSLGRARSALRPIGLAIGAVLVSGIPLSFGLGVEYAAVAFIVGAGVFGAASALQTQRLFAGADYYYYSSF
jgi:HD-GYP domain-containing protein (c-di-GMP phosphodiesterase class II)